MRETIFWARSPSILASPSLQKYRRVILGWGRATHCDQWMGKWGKDRVALEPELERGKYLLKT